MIAQAVIGCGFGDEGKGRVVDFLCSKTHNPLVIRYSGGHQAGHHVIRDGVDHVFSNFGSGSISGAETYWSSNCTVDPVGLMNEFYILKRKGVSPKLWIDKDCPITTPYDKKANLSLERINNHGSCGVGFGQTIQREEDLYSLKFFDLYFPSVFETKLNLIKHYYFPNELSEPVLEHFIESCTEAINLFNIAESGIFSSFVNKHNEITFEGSQGLMLDKDIGFFPHVTRSNVGLRPIHKLGYYPKVYLVTRAYQTRHGNGPMTTNVKIKDNPYEQNSFESFQGKFRKSILDIDLLNYAINKDPFIRGSKDKSLIITCLDVLDEYKFVLNKDVIEYKNKEDFIANIECLLDIKVAYTSSSPTGDLEIYA